MKILGLTAYSSGYRGFLDDDEQYVYFRASFKKISKLQAYDKASFDNTEHFIGLMSRFFPLTAFYRKPLCIDALSISELNRIHSQTRKKK